MPAMIPPEIQERVLQMANGTGLSHRKISLSVGISHGTVKSIIDRGCVKYALGAGKNQENDGDGKPLDGKVVEERARQEQRAVGNSTTWEKDHQTTLELVYNEQLRLRYEEAKRMMMERDRIDRLQTVGASDG